MEYLDIIPTKSKTLLASLIGSTLNLLVRCSWEKFDVFNKENLYHISQADFLRFASGPVILVLGDGREIAFYSEDSISSIIIWLEKNRHGRENRIYFRSDPELVLIPSSDVDFTTSRVRNLNGKMITDVKIFKRKSLSPKYEDLPNEVGVQIQLENGEIFLLGHNLISSANNFSILFKQEISNSLLDQLEEILLR